MRNDRSDEQLREFFADARSGDARRAPAFDRVLNGGEGGRFTIRWGRVAAAIILPAASLLWMTRTPHPAARVRPAPDGLVIHNDDSVRRGRTDLFGAGQLASAVRRRPAGVERTVGQPRDNRHGCVDRDRFPYVRLGFNERKGEFMSLTRYAMVAVLAVVAATGWAQQPGGQGQYQGGGADRQPGNPGGAPVGPQMGGPVPGGVMSDELFPPELVMRYQQAIGLKEDQRTAIRAVMQKTMARFTDVQWQQTSEAETLATLVKQQPVDEKKALEVFDRLLNAENEVKRLHFALLIEIKNTLTAEQQAKLRELQRQDRSSFGNAPGRPGMDDRRGPGGQGQGGPGGQGQGGASDDTQRPPSNAPRNR